MFISNKKVSFGYVNPDFNPDAYEPNNFLYEIEKTISAQKGQCISAIHGPPSAGKSSVANWLARKTKQKIVSLDEFYSVNQNGFDENQMRDFIYRLKENGDSFIIDGVCACRIMQPDIAVLIKKSPYKTTSRLREFIGDYDFDLYSGRINTFKGTCLQQFDS